MQLSREQRWILSNQYRILQLLDPESTKEYDTAREAINRGFEAYYDEIIPYIYEDTLSEAESHEIIQIMVMFDQLERAYDSASPKPDVSEYAVRFRGFDGNQETKYLTYVRFVIDETGRFRRFAGRDDNLNSHGPTLDAYRRMLGAWEALPDERRFQPTAEDVKNITDEAFHPSNRPPTTTR